MDSNFARVIYSRDEIQSRVRTLAKSVRADLQGDRPVLVSVLKGSVIFLADLVRELGVDSDVDFMSISSYGDPGSETGVVRILKDLEEPLEDREVVVVEDIVDTGFTLSYLLRTLQTRNPRSLKVCALVDKTVRRIADLTVDYSGFESGEFLIGYGLDFHGRYRNLPYLAAVTDIRALAAEPEVHAELFQDWPAGGR